MGYPTNTYGLTRTTYFRYVGDTKAYKCPSDKSIWNGAAKVRSYSANCFMAGRDIINGGAGFIVMFLESDIDKPGDRWVFIDENEKSINDGFFAVDMVGGSVLGGTDSNVQFGTLAPNDLIQYNGTYWTNVTPASVISGAGGAPVTKTANFSVANGETWLINNKSGSSCTVTLPTASSYTGRTLYFQNYQAQTLVSASSNVVPIAGGAAGTAILAAVAGDTCTLVSDGTNWVTTQYVPNNVLLLE